MPTFARPARLSAAWPNARNVQRRRNWEVYMPTSDYLKWLATSGTLSRRAFIERAAALGVSTALVTSLASKGVFAQTAPQKGGDLKIGIDGGESTNSLDPATYLSTYIQTVGFQWGNCLVELDRNNNVTPELAESWEPSDDATQ